VVGNPVRGCIGIAAAGLPRNVEQSESAASQDPMNPSSDTPVARVRRDGRGNGSWARPFQGQRSVRRAAGME
jgi:hypothetical protein